MDLPLEVWKAYFWDITHPGKVGNKAAYLNNWLARAYPDYQKRHAEEEAKRERDRRRLRASPRGTPDTRKIDCDRCRDLGVVPATMTTRWGEEVACMSPCPKCAFQRRAAQ